MAHFYYKFAAGQMFSITSGAVKFRGLGKAVGYRSPGSSPRIEHSGKNSTPFWAAQCSVPTTAGWERKEEPQPPGGHPTLSGSAAHNLISSKACTIQTVMHVLFLFFFLKYQHKVACLMPDTCVVRQSTAK